MPLMAEHLNQILVNQFEAALRMLKGCIEACPADHWEAKIANDTFRQIAYHTLFFVDLYLSPTEESFQLRELNQRGGDERGEELSAGLSKVETLEYLRLCRQKMLETLAVETADSLAGPSGFSYKKFTRAELYVYNIRHVQHHTGALSAHLRRTIPSLGDPKSLRWVSAGWRD
jgi:uncharacterized damage-inducible protein DinB